MNVRDHDYTPIVAKYYPLATRRLADEAIFLLKILNGFVDCPQLLNVINFHTASYFSYSLLILLSVLLLQIWPHKYYSPSM